jgi:hypothetical protein
MPFGSNPLSATVSVQRLGAYVRVVLISFSYPKHDTITTSVKG